MTRPPLLLAAHGTRDPAGVAAFAALARRVGDLAGRDGTPVAGGFIELSAPALREAVTTLAGVPSSHLVAVPLMLSAAGHAKGDIPAALARERARHPAVRFTYARPLGPHASLIDLLDKRVAAAGGDPAGGQGDRPSAATSSADGTNSRTLAFDRPAAWRRTLRSRSRQARRTSPP